MKDLSSLNIEDYYDSKEQDILWDFYIPVLSCANSYDRIAGFFSSGSLALAARGMSSFIQNGGKMRLVTCPRFSKNDIKIIEQTQTSLDEVLSNEFIGSYEEIEDAFERDHVKALGWMLANNKLEIKIALIKKDGCLTSKEEIDDSGIMHQKIGILRDQVGNIISFSGSLNESVGGWKNNNEQFDVFKSYEGQLKRINRHIESFERFWSGNKNGVVIKDIPQAIKEHLLKESKDFNPEYINPKKYYKVTKAKNPLRPFYYQRNAIQLWNNSNRTLLLQMATGTGKTRTAYGCLQLAIKDTNKLLVIIATPQPTLSSQWKADASGLDLGIENEIEINGSIPKWDLKLDTEIKSLSIGLINHLIVYTTHDICQSKKFLDIIKNASLQITKFLIGDEIHGMGAKEMRKGLIDDYRYRLGLSATPQRWFDDSGSAIIGDYFNNQVFEFGIKEALSEINPLTGKTFLVNYYYYPRFVSMAEDEVDEYVKLTAKLIKMKNSSKEEIADYIQFIRFKRADIEKNAEDKYRELTKILDEIGSGIQDTIIFVSPAQMDRVLSMLGNRGIVASPFTQEQSTEKSQKYNGLSEREFIIEKFKDKTFQVLVAIKCLDEGIDIPSASRAIIMASSTNPREYVQRIGRVIRQSADKKQAEIYDMIIKPNLNAFHDKQQLEAEKKILEKEKIRVLELSRNALNNVSAANITFSAFGGI